MEKYLINKNNTVREAITKMEKGLVKGLVVVEEDNRVIGIFTNGDMRVFFLKGGKLSDPVLNAMNKTPQLYHSDEEVMEERKNRLRVIYPVIDKDNKLLKVVDFENAIEEQRDSLRNIPLVIMAGGKGSRLYPYTKILPKPLIPIGEETITERIINSFHQFGCNRIIMVLNYKASMIRSYFDDIKRDYSVEYIEEEEFLGTAGGLKLIRDKVDSTFFLSNCDILIDTNYEEIISNHRKKKNKISFVCSMKDIVIPYGVVKTSDDGYITGITEKPDYSFLVNTGLYVMEPEVIDEIGDEEFLHLPDLALRLISRGEKVGAFPISEKAWMDMGQFTEMENMKRNLGL